MCDVELAFVATNISFATKLGKKFASTAYHKNVKEETRNNLGLVGRTKIRILGPVPLCAFVCSAAQLVLYVAKKPDA